MSLPSFRWMYYLFMAHLAEKKGGIWVTACNRKLAYMDESGVEVPENHKCETCKKYALKFRRQENNE